MRSRSRQLLEIHVAQQIERWIERELKDAATNDSRFAV
jgi:hypothetical protein